MSVNNILTESWEKEVKTVNKTCLWQYVNYKGFFIILYHLNFANCLELFIFFQTVGYKAYEFSLDLETRKVLNLSKRIEMSEVE